MHLHEFLAELHSVVQPKTYLEVGVQYGTSLKLAHAATLAIGVDPMPLHNAEGNQLVWSMPSDDYFAVRAEQDKAWPSNPAELGIDFGFVDGLHHYEQALRDFLNIERYCHERSIIVMDDVLPRNWGEASREMCPGDWTGDVWKASEAIVQWRPELRTFYVDTQPTGTLLAYGFTFEPTYPEAKLMASAASFYGPLEHPPASITSREYAVEPGEALDRLRGYLA